MWTHQNIIAWRPSLRNRPKPIRHQGMWAAGKSSTDWGVGCVWNNYIQKLHHNLPNVSPNMFSFPTGRYFNSSAPGRSICRWRIPAVFRSMPSSSMWRCLPWCLSRWNIWLVSARSHAGRSMAILGHGLGRCWIFWRFRMMGWSWFVTWSLHFWWGFSSRHRGWCKRNPHTYQVCTEGDMGYPIHTSPQLFADGICLFVFLVFCCISVWGSFPCYLLHFEAKIFHLRANYCILELEYARISYLLAYLIFDICFLAFALFDSDSWLLVFVAFYWMLLAFGFGFAWLLALILYDFWLSTVGFIWL